MNGQPTQPTRRYGRISALILSLYSPSLYRYVAARWRGVGFLYLLLVLFLTWIPTTFKMHVGIREFAITQFPNLIQDFPAITITNGVASSPVSQPHYMKDPESGKTIFILDTTGQITQLPEGKDPMMLLTATQFHFRNQNETRVMTLEKDANFYIDRQKLQGWMDWFAEKGAFILAPLGLLGTFIFRMFTTLVYALVGLIFNASFSKNLSFGALMRLAAVATTPVIYLNTAFLLADRQPPLWTLLGIALTCVYVAMAVKWADPVALPPPQYPPSPYAAGPYPPPASPYAAPQPGYYPPPAPPPPPAP